MENLAYLYILAEEAESEAPITAPMNAKTPQRRSWSQSVLRLVKPTSVARQKGAETDRTNQSYPTFYL
jgi:hypothetical protein